jgi:CRISPR/Cas system-associated exonuclease Cas4 (RecB family)
VRKLPWGISEGESFGASVHVALKRWGEEELKIFGVLKRDSGLGIRTSGRSKKGDVREDQMGLFAEHAAPVESSLTEEKLLAIWHGSFIFDTYPTRFEADFARKQGEELMRQFFRWWSGVPRKVLAVEKGFAVAVDGMEVMGRLDRIEEVEGGVEVVDYKTVAPCSQEEADADLQLSLYALAAEQLFEKPCRKLLFLFLSEDGVTERMTSRSPSQLRDARTQLRLIRERVEAKDFRPTPSASVCKRCPYRGICDVAAA